MKWVQFMLLSMCLCFCSCSTINKTLTLPQLKETACYAGVANMKLYSAPDYGSPTSLKVPLNEKVILVKTKHKWAFVKVERTGATGWVEKAYLEREPLGLKKTSKVKGDDEEGRDIQKATAPKEEEKVNKGVLDTLGPSPAMAAPSPEEEENPTEPRTEADIFDAF